MSAVADFERGPKDESGEFIFDQERLERDYELTQRVQAGYTPPTKPNPDTGQYRIVDGTLDTDAQVALAGLWGYYEPAAHKIANKHRGIVAEIPAVEVSDLEAEAFWGLYHAAVKWDPSKNVTFLTHSSSLMLQYMWRFLDAHATNVRVPANVRADIRKANRMLWRLYQGDEHLPRRQRLAAVMGITLSGADAILNAEAITHQMGSLDRGYFEDDRDKHSIHGMREDRWKPIDPAATEQQAVEETFLFKELQQIARDTLSDSPLTDREREIIRLRFFEKLTLEEVGLEFGVTRARISVIEGNALAKLRHPKAAPKIRDLLVD